MSDKASAKNMPQRKTEVTLNQPVRNIARMDLGPQIHQQGDFWTKSKRAGQKCLVGCQKALPLPRDFPLIESRLRGKVADI
jgi:hypothetical protein